MMTYQLIEERKENSGGNSVLEATRSVVNDAWNDASNDEIIDDTQCSDASQERTTMKKTRLSRYSTSESSLVFTTKVHADCIVRFINQRAKCPDFE